MRWITPAVRQVLIAAARGHVVLMPAACGRDRTAHMIADLCRKVGGSVLFIPDIAEVLTRELADA